MNVWTHPSGWAGRATQLAYVIVLPFAGFLISQRYPIYRPESIVALACLGLVAAVLAYAARGPGFYALFLGVATAVLAVPAQRLLSPLRPLGLPAVVFLIAGLLSVLLLWLRGEVFSYVAIFALGSFVAHVGAAFWVPPRAMVVSAAPVARPAHFLYLALDEHMGPDGFPVGIPACRQAANAVFATFRPYGFRLYPAAYSNFPMTLQSLPSLLNRSLLTRRGMLMHPGSPDHYGVHDVDGRRFFAELRSRGYQASVLQGDTIHFARGVDAQVSQYTSQIGPLAAVDGDWTDKFRIVVGGYQHTNSVMTALKGFLPFRFGPRPVGALAVTPVWPEAFGREILAARRPTLFFAHLMMPHGPYLYRRDGSVRPLAEWESDHDFHRLSASEYGQRYERYSEQIEYLHNLLRGLFRTLDENKLLDRMTIVVHGDHGSRIRSREARNVDRSEHLGMDDYDYTGPPEPQDLLDRFSALLAVKLPYARTFTVDERRASILAFLMQDVYHENPAILGPAVNSVFLFGPDGNAREIRMEER